MVSVIEQQQTNFEIFNVSNTDTISVKWIAEQVVAIMGEGKTGAEIVYENSDRGWLGDIPKYRMSSEKISKNGWQPTLTSIEAVNSSISSNLQ
jgi:UDP-glucose 4-epimerase